MKIRYLKENYFKDVTSVKRKRTGEEIARDVAARLCAERTAKQIQEIDEIKLSSIIACHLDNMSKAAEKDLIKYKDGNYRTGDNLYLNKNKITLDPRSVLFHDENLHKKYAEFFTYKNFYQDHFKYLGANISAGTDNPFGLCLIQTRVNKTFSSLDINIDYICMPTNLDTNMFIIWTDVYKEKYKKDLIYDDIPEEAKDDAIVKMAGGPAAKFAINFLREHPEYTCHDLPNCGSDYNLAMALTLPGNSIDNLKKETKYFRDFLSKALGLPVTITLWYQYRQDKTQYNNPPNSIKILWVN